MSTPAYSIVVCTYNRLASLKKCLASLLALDFLDYEIIIVDDASSDGTREFLDALKDEKIRVIHNEKNSGVSISKNKGWTHARADIVAFTDDDCEVDKNWLRELTMGFDREGVDFVIGATFYIHKGYRGYFPERLVNNQNGQWPGGGNIAYRKKVFEKCGGFDDYFFAYNNEDSEMAIRAVSAGFGFARNPKAIVNHQAANWTVKSLLRSAKNASVWPILKKRYPSHYAVFGSPVFGGRVVNKEDYLYLAFLPIFIIVLFVRYVMHGKRDIKIFVVKWPLYLFLRRYYIYKEAWKNRIFMI